MKRLIYVVIAFLFSSQANATLISVTGPNSNLGTAATIIGAPSDALDDFVTNTGMQGFDEAQGVVATVAHGIDGGGMLIVGNTYDSHMIFLNTLGGTLAEQMSVIWTFAGQIVGVMSDSGGTLEAASTFEFGAAGTNYTVGAGAAPFAARGLEGNNGTGNVNSDGYLVTGNSIRVSMRVTEPGDWIRVITVSVPEPGTLGLLGVGLLGLGFARRRRA